MSRPLPVPLAAVILAGGRSSRMGRRKEALQLPGGLTMGEHVACIVRAMADRLILSGDAPAIPAEQIGAMALPDRTPGIGPLGGMEAALCSGIAHRYLFVTCDQVRLLPETLLPLLSVVSDDPLLLVLPGGEVLSPFPCVLPASLADDLSAAIARGERSPRRFLSGHLPTLIPAPVATLHQVLSINTTDELAAFTAEISALANE